MTTPSVPANHMVRSSIATFVTRPTCRTSSRSTRTGSTPPRGARRSTASSVAASSTVSLHASARTARRSAGSLPTGRDTTPPTPPFGVAIAINPASVPIHNVSPVNCNACTGTLSSSRTPTPRVRTARLSPLSLTYTRPRAVPAHTPSSRVATESTRSSGRPSSTPHACMACAPSSRTRTSPRSVPSQSREARVTSARPRTPTSGTDIVPSIHRKRCKSLPTNDRPPRSNDWPRPAAHTPSAARASAPTPGSMSP